MEETGLWLGWTTSLLFKKGGALFYFYNLETSPRANGAFNINQAEPYHK